jgi:hypothetical protein
MAWASAIFGRRPHFVYQHRRRTHGAARIVGPTGDSKNENIKKRDRKKPWNGEISRCTARNASVRKLFPRGADQKSAPAGLIGDLRFNDDAAFENQLSSFKYSGGVYF